MASQIDIQNLGKQLTLAREMAILGDYDGALEEFKTIFTTVTSYSKKYDGNTGDKKYGQNGQPIHASADYYLQEKWNQFKKDLKHEYDMIVSMHKTLLLLEGNPASSADAQYEVDGFGEAARKDSRTQPQSAASKRTPNLEKKKTGPPQSSGQKARGYADKYGNPPVARSHTGGSELKFEKRGSQGAPKVAQSASVAQSTDRIDSAKQRPRKASRLEPAGPQTPYIPGSGKASGAGFGGQPFAQPASAAERDGRMMGHFGGKAPFQHHQEPRDINKKPFGKQQSIDDDQDAFPQDSHPFNEPAVSHQVFVQKPSGQPWARSDAKKKLNNNNDEEFKDPDVWDPPTPKVEKKRANNWGAGAQQRGQAGRGQPAAAARKAAGGGNPLGHYGQVDKAGGAQGGAGGRGNNNRDRGNRNYDKPWALPEKEKKAKAETYAEHVYPDGIGPDTDLINMIEREVLCKNPGVEFDDIADLDETKKLLQEAVLLPILMPDYFRGIRRPWKGICMFGPPGTGKTMLAKAIATQGRTRFFNVSASSLGSKWKGESEKLVRILFECARFYAPSTIFFDEIDALASQRGGSGEHEASRRVKSELLIQMDGVSGASSAGANEAADEEEAAKTVMVLAATNRPWDLDEAIRRRLEKRVYIPLPTPPGRRNLFEINLKGIDLDSSVDFDELVTRTDGYSGADLANVCREAAMMPMRRKLASGDFSMSLLKDHAEDIETPLCMEDFVEATRNISRSVGQDQLDEFQQWMDQFGSS